jgi:hypothetical protein
MKNNYLYRWALSTSLQILMACRHLCRHLLLTGKLISHKTIQQKGVTVYKILPIKELYIPIITIIKYLITHTHQRAHEALHTKTCRHLYIFIINIYIIRGYLSTVSVYKGVYRCLQMAKIVDTPIQEQVILISTCRNWRYLQGVGGGTPSARFFQRRQSRVTAQAIKFASHFRAGGGRRLLYAI